MKFLGFWYPRASIGSGNGTGDINRFLFNYALVGRYLLQIDSVTIFPVVKTEILSLCAIMRGWSVIRHWMDTFIFRHLVWTDFLINRRIGVFWKVWVFLRFRNDLIFDFGDLFRWIFHNIVYLIVKLLKKLVFSRIAESSLSFEQLGLSGSIGIWACRLLQTYALESPFRSKYDINVRVSLFHKSQLPCRS